MIHPQLVSWIIIIFGLITCVPLLIAQIFMLIDPNGVRSKEILIGKGEEWRDKSHFKSAYSLAVVDWLVFFPIYVAAIAGVILNTFWGYLFLSIAGCIQLYINAFLWFFEKEYVYPANGPLRYYTYLWGNFMYWGAAALIFGMLQLHQMIS